VRVAFFVLLFANLVFMAWAGWVDAPGQTKPPDTHGRLPQLKLVSELSPAQQGGQSGGGTVKKMAVTSSGESPTLPPVAARCVSVGPFSDIEVAAKAAGALQARGFTPQQRAAEGESWDGFWVYIGGVGDPAAADKIFKSLDRSGIKDARLMPESSDGRRISVGLFSERDRAERRAKAIQRLGFKAAVEEHTQPGTVYWVDLALKPSDGSVPVQDLLSANSGNSRLSVQSCPPHPADPPGSPEAAPATAPATAPPGPRVPATTVAGTPKYPDGVR
jgi:hypothetical protein